jgi:endonuclease/exonuclease/phosphatase family metal-dependent hydrolase
MKIKKIIQIILIVFTFNFLSAEENKESIENSEKLPIESHLRIASYNLRYKTDLDIESGNEWDKRKHHIVNIINNYDIEIVGTQEGNFGQMDDLLSLLPNFDYVGYPYGGTSGTIHTASILFKKTRFEVMSQGRFWYSETPDIESIGWDAHDLRICTWARMKDKQNGLQFYFFTSHFYFRYQDARENSGKVMVNKIKEIVIDDLPIISTGDFNSSPSSHQINYIKTFLQSAYEVTELSRSGPEETFYPKFKYDSKNLGRRLDYVFVNKKVHVLTYNVLDYTYDDNRFPSDHLPVVCDLIIKR